MWTVRLRRELRYQSAAERLGLLGGSDGLDGEITGVGLGRTRRCIRVCACGDCYASGRLARRHWCRNRALAGYAAAGRRQPESDLRPGLGARGGMPMHHRIERLVSLGRRAFVDWRLISTGKLSARVGRYSAVAITGTVRRLW